MLMVIGLAFGCWCWGLLGFDTWDGFSSVCTAETVVLGSDRGNGARECCRSVGEVDERKEEENASIGKEGKESKQEDMPENSWPA